MNTSNYQLIWCFLVVLVVFTSGELILFSLTKCGSALVECNQDFPGEETSESATKKSEFNFPATFIDYSAVANYCSLSLPPENVQAPRQKHVDLIIQPPRLA